MNEILTSLTDNWVFWLVSLFAVVAAYIDGKQLRVPNKLTFPMIIAGWIFCTISWGVSGQGWYWGLGFSLLGTIAGIATLLPAYSIGGMGAGDAKMMAAIGAWLGAQIVIYSFCVGAVIGAVLAIIMIVSSGDIMKHYYQFWMILNEFKTVRNPEKLAQIATERKTTMRLLPYGIPMAIGTVLYLAWTGKLV